MGREEDRSIVLVRRRRALSAVERYALAGAGVLVAGVLAYAIRWGMFDSPGGRMLAGPEAWAPFALAMLLVMLTPLITRGMTLRVDPAGIRLLARSGRVLRDVPWDQATRASYLERHGMLTIRVARGAPLMLHPAEWALPDAAAAPAGAEPVLLTLVRERGLLGEPGAQEIAAEFDLMADHRSRAVLAVGALLGGYAVIDRLAQREGWAFFDLPYLLPHGIAALALAVFVGAKLAASIQPRPLPRAIAWGLAVFIAVAAGPASYMAGIRLNQMLAFPLEARTYHRDADCMNLVPADAQPDLPVIEYTRMTKDYWCSIPERQPVEVLVRRGLFGLYQLNLEPQSEAIDRFFRGRGQ